MQHLFLRMQNGKEVHKAMTVIDIYSGFLGAGKTTLISRILKEFKQEDGWRVITIPETATELISGFGIKPFGDCVTVAFQGEEEHRVHLLFSSRGFRPRAEAGDLRVPA